MKIKVGKFDFTEVWDGTFYKKLSDYPNITDWEVRTLIEFIDYEAQQGRACTIDCEDASLLQEVREKIAQKEKYKDASCPPLITECTACPYRKGCVTEYVCHTTSAENAASIFTSGRLLSAVRARNLPAEQLMEESRNAAKDPADYFYYIMFAWGNCQAGDRLVMERALGRFPNVEDLSIGFAPGVRFYFKYDRLAGHPNAVFDGVLPMKVRDEVVLADWVDAIVIPTALRAHLEEHIPQNLKDKVLYIENDCKDLWDWSEKVYCAVCAAYRS
ncbi:MAG: phosphate ABC transporter ATPase [Clostridia bacterium]|nr:phosphate ABC transporter ATPase [Clostridia bacterium]